MENRLDAVILLDAAMELPIAEECHFGSASPGERV
jgi:hypothetical protein